ISAPVEMPVTMLKLGRLPVSLHPVSNPAPNAPCSPPPERARMEKSFLGGDAAHVHSPAGGQGMNTGMQDAFNLAWKLALVIRKTCDDHLLDSYSPERSKVGDEVLKAASRLTTVGTLSNPVAQTVRNLIGRVMLGLVPIQHEFAD